MRCGSPAALGLAAQWSFWAVLELEELLLDLLMHRALLPEFSRERSHAERDELLLQKPLSVLNAALAERRFRAGERKRSQRASILSWGKIAEAQHLCAFGGSAMAGHMVDPTRLW